MTSATFSTSIEAQQAAVLLENYRFELGHHDARQWVSLWLEFYRPGWIRDAVVEALYQGRYKSVSVRQILELWHRRGRPIRHVTYEFEAAICREFGEVRLAPTNSVAALPPQATLSVDNDRSAASNLDLSAGATVPGMHSSPSTAADQVAAAATHSSVETVDSPHLSGSTAADSDLMLRTQRQFKGVLYASARAIQPFKPTLPFSAQTLRLARRKILV
ncbi:MAG: hypothetical protein WBB01_14960 [Phormidesmis sp.]